MNFLSPIKRFGVIYADPPWNFRNFSEKGTGRNAVAHYKCMDFEQLAAMQPQRWAARNCVLFLWATDPLLPKALELIDAWGFTYKTVGFYWAKTNKHADLDALTVDDFFTGLGRLPSSPHRSACRALSVAVSARGPRRGPGQPLVHRDL